MAFVSALDEKRSLALLDASVQFRMDDGIVDLDHPATGGQVGSDEEARSRSRSCLENDLKEGLGKRKLRVAIVTENFLPKIDGVTRTLARLLEHLGEGSIEAIVLGPESGMTHYAGHALVGTAGVPLVLYPGLKLNFFRPRFLRKLREFQPDVIHYVDPIWLGAQSLPLLSRLFPDTPSVSSYHTNLPTYAALFGLPWLQDTMWSLSRWIHGKTEVTFCPSPSTRRMLEEHGFSNLRVWGRGVDVGLFNPDARDQMLRESWGCCLSTSFKEKAASLSNDCPSPMVLPPASACSFEGEGDSLAEKEEGIRLDRTPRARRTNSTGSATVGAIPGYTTRPCSPLFTSTSPPPAYDSLSPPLPPLPSSPFALPSAVSSAPDGPAFRANATGSTTKAKAAAAAAEEKVVVLYVGRLSWEKNLRLLIEAFRALSPAAKERAKLVLVGDGPARKECEGLCKSYGLDAVFMGHLRGRALAKAYASADVKSSPSFTETFGQVTLEGLASGLPVVGLWAEGTSDLVCHGETGLLLDVTDLHAPADTAPLASSDRERPRIPSASFFHSLMNPASPQFSLVARRYAELLETLVAEPDLRRRMSVAAAESALRHTWSEAMGNVVRGYREVTEAARVARAAREKRRRDRKERLGQIGALFVGGPVGVSLVGAYLLAIVFMWLRVWCRIGFPFYSL